MKTYTQLMVWERQRKIFFIAGATGMLPNLLQVVTHAPTDNPNDIY